MVAKSFQVGDLVWAKMKGFPPWPGKIVAPPSEAKVKKSHHYVFFYGSDNHAWIADENIALHNERLVEKYTRDQKRPPVYLSAVEIIVNASKGSPKYQKNSENSFGTLSGKEGTTPKSKSPKYQKNSANSFDTLSGKESTTPKSKSPKYQKNSENSFDTLSGKGGTTPKSKSSKYQKNSENSFDTLSGKEGTTPKSKSPHSNIVTKKREMKKVPVKKISIVKKNSRKRAASSDHYSTESSSFDETPSKLQRNDEDFSDLLANIPPNYSYSDEPRIESGEIEEPIQSSCRLMTDNYIDRPPTPSLDLRLENELLKKKKIDPSKKKFGFLGLGKMGQGIVKNLIQSGHSVTVWSRSIEKCDEFIKIGAEKLGTPADVVSCCDVTFCCVSDPHAAKQLVFGNCGVLKGLEEASNVGNKGYVELTYLDPKTSQAIADEVTLKGGRYLEAPLNGSRSQAIDGSLFVLGAGDKSLFDDCETCFRAMGENALFIGNDVGVAAKYNIIHNMLLGTVYASVAESLALVDRIGLDQTDFLDILQYGVLNNSVIIERGHSMIKNEYTSNTSVRHMQIGLNLGLMLGGSAEQPMPIVAATNEVYKHCKHLRYGDHDVSAIYEGTKR